MFHKSKATLGFALAASSAVAGQTLAPNEICQVANGTGLLSAPCDFSIIRDTITMEMRISRGEASKLCDMMAGEFDVKGGSMTLNITTPTTYGEPVASCRI